MSAAAVLAALSSAAWLYGNASNSYECVLLRTEFAVPEPVDDDMTVFVGLAAAGYAEVWLNGHKADEAAALEPAWMQWNRRLLVPTYEVKELVHRGTNALGLALGAGWYGHLGHTPAIKAALVVTKQSSGESTSVLTNANWSVGRCPITYNDIYNGETYDARLEEEDWALPGGGSSWESANASATPPNQTEGATLSLQMMPPISRLEVLPVAELVTARANGSVLLDFGVNIAGWVQLSLDDCKPGTTVTIRHAEILSEDRTELYTRNLQTAKATDTYICRGGPVFHEPRFTYHGFRFVEISVNGTAAWSWANQKARIVHSAVQGRGEIVLENHVLTKIHAAIRQTLLDNFHSVPTDCPQRAERKGWMADGALAGEAAAFNFNMKSFYINWVQVMVDAQETGNHFGECRMPAGSNASIECKGAVTEVAPQLPGMAAHRPADPSWGIALPLIVEILERHYGAEAAATSFTPAVHAWADFLLSVRDDDGIVRYYNYGDWLQPGRSGSTKLISQMTSGFSSIVALRFASTLGTPEERQHYANEAATMQSSYLAAFWNSTAEWFGDGTQAAQVFPLTLEGLSPEQDAGAWNRLVALVKMHGIGTGIVSTRFLFPLLSKRERTDLGLLLASSTAYPSWGYEIEKGATTIWEHFDGLTANPHMNSFNHPCLTSVGSWFYTDLAGIRVHSGGSLELGPTLNEYNALLPSAQGSVMFEEGLAEIKWSMRSAEVNVAGRCPRASCVARVPLNGIEFARASADLKQQGLQAVVPCGPAACGNVTTGVFSFNLASQATMLLL